MMKLKLNWREFDAKVAVPAGEYTFKRDGAGVMTCNVEDPIAVDQLLLHPDIELYGDTPGDDAANAEDESGQGTGDDPEDPDEEFGASVPSEDAITEAAAKYETWTEDELRAEWAKRKGRAAHPATAYTTLVRRLAEMDLKG